MAFWDKYPFTNFHELNLDWILEKIVDLDQIMKKFVVDTKDTIIDTVNKWLDEHPEATTTVQDGAITRPKFSSSLNDQLTANFDILQDMLDDETLTNGMYARISGRYTQGDGGAQLYYISDTKPRAQSGADVPRAVYEELNNGLYAIRIVDIDKTRYCLDDKVGDSCCGLLENNASVITELLNVCSTYEDNGDKLYYGHYSALDFGINDVSRGLENNKYQIDCSSFVQLALAGITFESSRYNVDDNYFVSQYCFFPYTQKTEYKNYDTWAKYRLSDCQAKFAYENGYSFLPNFDWTNVQPGDVVYLQDGDTTSSTNWNGVDHVMIYLGRREKDHDLVFYECGGNANHRTSVSSYNIVHVRTSTFTFMQSNTKLIARYPLGNGSGNADGVIYRDMHPTYPVTFSASAKSATYHIDKIKQGEWYSVVAKIKSAHGHPYFRTDAGHQMLQPDENISGIYTNTFRAVTDFDSFEIGSYESTDSNIVFEDFKIIRGYSDTLNIPYKSSTSANKSAITGSYRNNTTSWEYVGLSITVPSNHKFLVKATQGWNSGKPLGLGFDSSDSAPEPYYINVSESQTIYGTPAFLLDEGTWYLYTKRGSVASSANSYAIYSIDIVQ